MAEAAVKAAGSASDRSELSGGESVLSETNMAAPNEDGKSKRRRESSSKKVSKQDILEKRLDTLDEKPVEHVYKSQTARHSDPSRVEDVFPLAITYQSDPKEASGNKIGRYISKFYRKEVTTDRLKKALESGIEKGMWEQTKGNGIHGSFHLLVDSFKPGHSETLTDQIAQALVACHEPKQASAGLIKKYITMYHPKLNVESRPYLFKNALERACYKGTLRQLSGIGASGTFQLVDQFHPSPAILAGDSSDEEEEDDDESEDEVEVKAEYIPRPTKRGRQASINKPRPPPATQKRSGKAQSKTETKGKSKGKSGRVKKEEISDDDDEPMEYLPQPSKSRGGGTPAKSKSKQAPKPATKKSAKKSAKPKPKGKNVKKATAADDEDESSSAAKTPARSGRKRSEPNYADSDDEIMPEYTPSASKSRGGKSPGKSEASPAKSGKATKRKLVVELDADFGQDEYVPKPTKSGRGAGRASASDETGRSGESSAKKRRR